MLNELLVSENDANVHYSINTNVVLVLSYICIIDVSFAKYKDLYIYMSSL